MDQEVSALILENKLFEASRKHLKNYFSRKKDKLPETFYNDLSRIKEESLVSENQKVAKAVWCLETIGSIQDCFISAFDFMHKDYFYQGWCQLIECETSIENLDRHFLDKNKYFGIECVRFQVNQFQKIFPYRLFCSPAFKAKNVFCSICNNKITPRNYCGHKVGEIYDGKLCFRYYDGMEFDHLLLCPRPKHKYIVPFNETISYNYAAVRYVVDRLKSPWDLWYCVKIPNDNTINHYNIIFEKKPPDELLSCKPIADYKVSTDPKDVTLSYLHQIGSKFYLL